MGRSRRRPHEHVSSGIPRELVDLNDPTWDSVATTRSWCEANGVTLNVVADSILISGPATRWEVAAEEYRRQVFTGEDYWSIAGTLGVRQDTFLEIIAQRASHG